jgi:hypothetical protein
MRKELWKPLILAAAIVLADGIIMHAWAQAPATHQTSTLSVNDVSLNVTADGVTQLRLSASMTSENGVGMTCLTWTADGTMGHFCEALTSGESQYACTLQGGTTVTGTCTCTGACAGLPNGCVELGGTLNGGTCTFPYP